MWLHSFCVMPLPASRLSNVCLVILIVLPLLKCRLHRHLSFFMLKAQKKLASLFVLIVTNDNFRKKPRITWALKEMRTRQCMKRMCKLDSKFSWKLQHFMCVYWENPRLTFVINKHNVTFHLLFREFLYCTLKQIHTFSVG